VRTLERLIGDLNRVFVSPNDVADEAPEEDFDLAADVDVLEATVVGGLRRRSVSTAAVLGGIEEAEAILAKYESTMTPPQLAAVRDLLSALRSA
jgi:hypothetical protein